MKKFRSFNEFGDLLKKDEVPNFNKGLVEEKIFNDNNIKKYRVKSFKVAVITCLLCIMSVATIAYAVEKINELYNEKGEVIYEVVQNESREEEAEEKWEKHMKVHGKYKWRVKQLEEKVKENQVLIYAAKDGDFILSNVSPKARNIYNLDEAKNILKSDGELKNVLKFPEYIPKDCMFFNMTITNEFSGNKDLELIREELKNKIKNSHEDFIYKIVKNKKGSNTGIPSVWVKFFDTKDYEYITISMRKASKVISFDSKVDEEKFSKINIGDKVCIIERLNDELCHLTFADPYKESQIYYGINFKYSQLDEIKKMIESFEYVE